MIYLDNNATTKPFHEVVDTMTMFMTSRFWNDSSAYGQLDGLEEVLDLAKTAIRKLCLLGSEDDIVFTSGATESNVWALAEGARRILDNGWILSSQIEHPSILTGLKHFQEQGLTVRWIPVTRDGLFDLKKVGKIVDSNLGFISLILAHNETGVIQPLGDITTLIRERSPNCLIHTDATQVIGKIPFAFLDDLSKVDLISFSTHKFHGPKGIGGLIIRNKVQIHPLIRGGGQQKGFRSGTLNIPAIAGLSVAANKCRELLQAEQHEAVRAIRDYFEERLCSTFPNVLILGRTAPRLPNTSFFGIPDTDADDLVLAMAAEGIALSKGSSCSAQSITPSKTASLMGYSYDEASSLIRFSASFNTSKDEVCHFFDKFKELCS